MIDADKLMELLRAGSYDFGLKKPGVWGPYESFFKNVDFTSLADDARCELAAHFIESCCGSGLSMNGDVPFFIGQCALDIAQWPGGRGYASRRIEHVSYALETFSDISAFASPRGALSAVFLLLQLEFFFRAISRHLDDGGRFINEASRKDAEVQLGRAFSKRPISRIQDAYALALLSQDCLAPSVFLKLDAKLFPVVTGLGDRWDNLGAQLAHMRNPAAHGPLADPSSQGVFYCLLAIIVIYGSALFERPLPPSPL
jgi:hypothetical protein